MKARALSAGWVLVLVAGAIRWLSICAWLAVI